MKTILVFPFNLLSHYLRCLVLADTYDKKLYNILFLHSDKYAHFVSKHGYQTFSCEQFNSVQVMECAAQFDFSWLNESRIEQIFLSQVEVIKTYQADIVIGDVAPTLKMAAEQMGVKYISLLNGYMTKYYAVTRAVPNSHRSTPFLKVLPKSLAAYIIRTAEGITFRKIHQPFKNLRKKYKLQELSDYLSEMVGNVNLICDQPDLFPQKNLPADYFFTGPLIYEYAETETEWISRLSTEKPVIFVSMGSTGDWQKLAFLNDPYYSRYEIVTAGDHQKILSAPHIIAREFVNIATVLQKSDLMICHGGNGTIYQGILNHVFLLCISSHFEQEWNMQALELKGYGKSANHFNDRQWKEQLNTLLPLKQQEDNCIINQ